MFKNNDFIEITYTGETEDHQVFDTTNEELAKETGIDSPTSIFGPIVICLGQGQLLEGLEHELLDKEVGKEYDITLPAEKGFGKKSAKLVQLIPARKFRDQKIDPMPGLQINVDGLTGVIKTVTGGRILVDFNHPLSGKTLIYQVKILKKVEDDIDKLKGFLKISLGHKEVKASIKEGKAEVEMTLQKPLQVEVMKKIKEVIPSIKEVTFKAQPESNK
ncbi:peptidylprolyl isomerase [Candidatus Woesearchaeota archaeon]|nr:peptidylprolyl isomerase [Candidatus Woesearchaeota archaeon]